MRKKTEIIKNNRRNINKLDLRLYVQQTDKKFFAINRTAVDRVDPHTQPLLSPAQDKASNDAH